MRLDTTQHEEKNCRNLAIVQSEPSMKEKTQALLGRLHTLLWQQSFLL